MRIKRILLLILLIIVLNIIIRGIRYTHYTPTLRIGVNSFSGGEIFQLARKALFFEKAGIHIKIVEFGSFGDVQQAFEWHQINGMICPLTDAMVIRQKVIYEDPKIILIPSYVKKQCSCQVLVNNSIKSIQELKGKNIGVEINSYGSYVLAKALSTEGLSLKDVNLIPIDPTAASRFFRHQFVDAVVSYPPFIEPIKDFTHCIYSSENWPKEMQLNVLLLRQSTIQNYKKQLIKFIKSWDKLLDYYKNNPSVSQKMLSIHHSFSFQEAENLFQRIQPLYLEEQFPLFRSNRHVLDVLSSINSHILKINNALSSLQTKEPLDSIFDAFFIKETLK